MANDTVNELTLYKTPPTGGPMMKPIADPSSKNPYNTTSCHHKNLFPSTITAPIEEGYITVAMVKALMKYAADPTPSKSLSAIEKSINCHTLFIIIINLQINNTVLIAHIL